MAAAVRAAVAKMWACPTDIRMLLIPNIIAKLNIIKH